MISKLTSNHIIISYKIPARILVVVKKIRDMLSSQAGFWAGHGTVQIWIELCKGWTCLLVLRHRTHMNQPVPEPDSAKLGRHGGKLNPLRASRGNK